MTAYDKAKVEAAVGIVSRFVLGKLRNRRFFSLVELNDAVRDCVTKINAKVMKHLKQSRNDLFASLDRPALKGLPSHSFMSKRLQELNWLQAMEGGIDSSHVSFLHAGELDSDPLFKGTLYTKRFKKA